MKLQISPEIRTSLAKERRNQHLERKTPRDISIGQFTCFGCPDELICEYAFDARNLDGKCLAKP